MFKLDLEKAEEPEIKLTISQTHRKEGHIKTEVETRVMHLQVKEYQGLLANTRS